MQGKIYKTYKVPECMSILDNLYTNETDPIERARKISDALSKDENLSKKYEDEQKMINTPTNIRILEDWGIYLRNNEMPRSEYLKKLSLTEQDTLCSFLKSIWLESTRKIFFGLIAVGTTTYRDENWEYLNRLTTLPNAKYIEYEINYAEQKECKPKREFKLEEILSNKGEDIDIKFLPIEDTRKASMDIRKVHDIIVEYARTNYIRMKSEKRNIIGTRYFTEPPLGLLKDGEPIEVQRLKEIEYLPIDSIHLSFPECRPIHCYFENTPMHQKLDWEKSEGYNFSTLVMNNNVMEFIDTIKNGQKTGIYEHPAMIRYQKILSENNKSSNK